MEIFSVEKKFIDMLANIWGFKAAVRIEDFLMIVCTLLLGYFLGQLRIAYLVKWNYIFSDKLKCLVFQKNEYKGIVQYDFKYPRTFLERIELIYALHLASRKKAKLSLTRAKWYSRTVILVITLLVIIMVFIISFMFNVVDYPEI
ncbi:hypothetical protein M5X00_26305 [Paenibacillus alvei]|uniref:hypothetical protein n=1 Tax=Paenibacillus alvei TaxID=44250 RepID=UPI000288BAB6|nr:hypothetical protein [Paenibacillus alvei]EJW14086.1 hypothetical protein PAV_141p01920 [Paenibacillus alvei DSM 29]MCY9545044.1 hypothetical protein [Paenibacillus alvei]MCY9707764.1 hypothetical protein [Paenibacillus alvei]MCY9757745.1 hypothetical protein [Paenibacillus alvei]MEC0082723.1 hypothetical protein [Paenibacillus alvei]